MSGISKFFLRDVRCFEGEHSFEIRPLTFLIGENSTGKSTVLGCLQALGTFLEHHQRNVDFNSEPYQMGAFSDIVRRSRPRKQEFQLGVETTYHNGATFRYFLTLVEKERGSEPFIRSARWVFNDGEVVLSAPDDDRHRAEHRVHVTQTAPARFHVQLNDVKLTLCLNLLGLPYMKDYFEAAVSYQHSDGDSQQDSGVAAKNLQDFINQKSSQEGHYHRRSPFGPSFGLSSFPIQSIAPVRSKPKRTYDPLIETETPDGSEVPVALMNLSISRKAKWNDLRRRLMDFGQASGLFSDIAIRKLGGSRGDPFQLQIKVSGPRVNLMDVGYGVSQVLPILVRILTGQRATFLLQQPEVHLHPKGQAELASLLVDVHQRRSTAFVIETHSDHMIDRVRIEIKQGRIRPDDVSLIYLEPVGNHVKTHNIRFDAHANMVSVPQHYRHFFLKEADQLLGWVD